MTSLKARIALFENLLLNIPVYHSEHIHGTIHKIEQRGFSINLKIKYQKQDGQFAEETLDAATREWRPNAKPNPYMFWKVCVLIDNSPYLFKLKYILPPESRDSKKAEFDSWTIHPRIKFNSKKLTSEEYASVNKRSSLSSLPLLSPSATILTMHDSQFNSKRRKLNNSEPQETHHVNDSSFQNASPSSDIMTQQQQHQERQIRNQLLNQEQYQEQYQGQYQEQQKQQQKLQQLNRSENKYTRKIVDGNTNPENWKLVESKTQHNSNYSSVTSNLSLVSSGMERMSNFDGSIQHSQPNAQNRFQYNSGSDPLRQHGNIHSKPIAFNPLNIPKNYLPTQNIPYFNAGHPSMPQVKTQHYTVNLHPSGTHATSAHSSTHHIQSKIPPPIREHTSTIPREALYKNIEVLKKAIPHSITQKASYIIGSKLINEKLSHYELHPKLKTFLKHNNVTVLKLEATSNSPSQEETLLLVESKPLSKALQERDRIRFYNIIEFNSNELTVLGLSIDSKIELTKNSGRIHQLDLYFERRYHEWQIYHSPKCFKCTTANTLEKLSEKSNSKTEIEQQMLLGVIASYTSVTKKKCYSTTLRIVDESNIMNPIQISFISDHELLLPRVSMIGQVIVVQNVTMQSDNRGPNFYRGTSESKYILINPFEAIKIDEHIPSVFFRLQQLQLLSKVALGDKILKSLVAKFQKTIGELISSTSSNGSDVIGIVECLDFKNGLPIFTLYDGTGKLKIYSSEGISLPYLVSVLKVGTCIKLLDITNIVKEDEEFICHLQGNERVAVLPDFHYVTNEIKLLNHDTSEANILSNVPMLKKTRIAINPLCINIESIQGLFYHRLRDLPPSGNSNINRSLVRAKIVEVNSTKNFCIPFCASCFTVKPLSNLCKCGARVVVYDYFVQFLLEDEYGDTLIVNLVSEDASYFFGIGASGDELVKRVSEFRLQFLLNHDQSWLNFCIEYENKNDPKWYIKHTYLSNE